MITGRTDRQTDRQSATQYAAPSYREEGRIITRYVNLHDAVQVQALGVYLLVLAVLINFFM